MGLYADYIFPRLMDWVMRGPQFQAHRHALLADARGKALEIGFGTGLNLPHYPAQVDSLTAVDSARLLPARVAERIAASSLAVQVAYLSAETLPFETGRFDCAVSTFTLCTIPDVLSALREIRRVLKPTGAFLFLEHGRSDDVSVARWQDRLDPVQQVVGCGCHLNRRIDRLILDAGFKINRLDRFRLPGAPRLAAEMYAGLAASPLSSSGSS